MEELHKALEVRDMIQGRCRASRYKLAVTVHKIHIYVLPFSRLKSSFPIGGVNSPPLDD